MLYTLHLEATAHATFARYIGESVPQRIGEPVYHDEIGGMVLELVGACWRVPELAHTQAITIPWHWIAVWRSTQWRVQHLAEHGRHGSAQHGTLYSIV